MPPPAQAADSPAVGVFPSKLHLALAIAVVQSKPEELAVEDYILHLRKHVREGRSGPASNRHLDSASYWAQRCEQAEATKYGLEAKVTEYEREIERLNSELRSAQGVPATRATAPSKRRKHEPSPGPSTRLSKKARLEYEDSRTSSTDTVESSLPENLDSLSAVSEEGSKLVQHLYQAHKFYRNVVRADRSLAYHLVQASDHLASLLTSACKQYQHRIGDLPSGSSIKAVPKGPIPSPVLARYENELISTFEAAARIFMSLLYGLKKLNSGEPIPEDCGAVIHSFVNNFDLLLDTLKEVTSTHAAQEAAATEASTSKKRMKTRMSQNAIRDTKRESLVTRLLSNFLVNVLAVPSTNEPRHRELLEGFLFVLFRRLGSRVFLCTFGHEKCDTVEGDIAAWVDPEAAEDTPPDRQKQIDLRALDLELPVLISLLERGLAVAQHHIAPFETPGPRKQIKGFVGKPGPRPSSESLRAGLSLAARNKLEQTLARAIFRDESGGDEMAECLTMPVRQVLMDPPQKTEQDDVKVWFIEKVWELVGWQTVITLR